MSGAETYALPAPRPPFASAAKIFGGASIALLAVAALLLFASIAPRLLGFATLAVTSASMGSTAPVGSLVIARSSPRAEIALGDVIVAQREEGGRKQAKVLHRVISLERDGSVIYVRTKGDANKRPDPGRYALPPRVLTQAFMLPYLGYFVGAMHIPLVWALLIGLPSVLLAALFMRDIWRPDDAEAPQIQVRAPLDLDAERGLEAREELLLAAEALLAEREQRVALAEARNAEETELITSRLALLDKAVPPAETDFRQREARLAALEAELDRHVTAIRRGMHPFAADVPAGEPAPSAAPPVTPSAHLLLVPGLAGSGLIERPGEAPAPGVEVTIAVSDERRFFVGKVARSPLSGDERHCAYLVPL